LSLNVNNAKKKKKGKRRRKERLVPWGDIVIEMITPQMTQHTQ
jgi:hypothetical protein